MTVNTPSSRRQFLAKIGGMAASSWASLTRGASANDAIRGGRESEPVVRGKYLIGNLPERARVMAICDCAESQMNATLEPQGKFKSVLNRFRETDAPRCARYQDLSSDA